MNKITKLRRLRTVVLAIAVVAALGTSLATSSPAHASDALYGECHATKPLATPTRNIGVPGHPIIVVGRPGPSCDSAPLVHCSGGLCFVTVTFIAAATSGPRQATVHLEELLGNGRWTEIALMGCYDPSKACTAGQSFAVNGDLFDIGGANYRVRAEWGNGYGPASIVVNPAIKATINVPFVTD